MKVNLSYVAYSVKLKITAVKSSIHYPACGKFGLLSCEAVSQVIWLKRDFNLAGDFIALHSVYTFDKLMHSLGIELMTLCCKRHDLLPELQES